MWARMYPAMGHAKGMRMCRNRVSGDCVNNSVTSRGAAHGLGRMAENTDKALAHAFRVCETDRPANDFQRFAAILDARTGGFGPQPFDRLGGCRAGAPR